MTGITVLEQELLPEFVLLARALLLQVFDAEAADAQRGQGLAADLSTHRLEA